MFLSKFKIYEIESGIIGGSCLTVEMIKNNNMVEYQRERVCNFVQYQGQSNRYVYCMVFTLQNTVCMNCAQHSSKHRSKSNQIEKVRIAISCVLGNF